MSKQSPAKRKARARLSDLARKGSLFPSPYRRILEQEAGVTAEEVQPQREDLPRWVDGWG